MPAHRFSRLLLTIWALVSCGGFAHAHTYYVSSSSKASDENSGTSRRPWRTISVAAKRAQAGDTVIVSSGDYRNEDTGWGTGVIPFLNSGTRSRPIQFRAERGSRPLVNRMFLKDCAYVSIEGFQFSGLRFDRVTGWRDMPCIVRDAASDECPDYTQPWEQRQEQIGSEFATYFRLVRQLEYITGIDVENCHDIKLENHRIDGFWAGIQCRHCERVKIASNRISHCVSGIFAWQPAPALVDSEICGNTITQSLDNGIDIREYSENVRIHDNVVSFSGRSHIALQNGVSNSRVRNNATLWGGYYSESMEYPGSSAINVHSSLSGNIVEANLIGYQIDLTGVDGNGVILDRMIEGSSVIVRNNIIWRNMGDGLNTTLSPGAFISKNSFIENGYGAHGYRRGAGIKLSRDDDMRHTIVSNEFLFNRVAGIMSYHIIDQQKSIDRNYYASWSVPLIWDGYAENDSAYYTLREVRQHTPWEDSGRSLEWPWRRETQPHDNKSDKDRSHNDRSR
jgi:hypothetical protein